MLDPTVDTVGILRDPEVDLQPVGRLRTLPFSILQVIALVVALTYAAIAWTLPRGFDLTDEAFVDALIASNRVTTGEPWGFHHLLHPLYVATGESVLALRVLRLVGYIALSVILVRLARAVLDRVGISIPRPAWTFIFLFAQVGTFLAWSYPPRYLGYNELASWFAQLGVALIVLSLSWGLSAPFRHGAPSVRLPSSRMLWAVWAGLGAISTLLVFSKVSSGVAFGLLLVLTLVVPNPHLRLARRAVAAGAGAMTVLFTLMVFGHPMLSYLGSAFTVLLNPAAQAASNHSLSVLIDGYADSMVFTGKALVPVLVLFALTMAPFRKRATSRRGAIATEVGRGRAAPGWVTWTLGALLLTALLVLPKRTSAAAQTQSELWLYLGSFVVLIGAAGIIGLVMVRADLAPVPGSAVRRSLSVAVGGLAVMATPFISAAGTNNALAGALVFAATLWAVVLGIALVLLSQRAAVLGSSARSVPLLFGCAVVLVAALAVKAHIDRPYRTHPLLAQQTSTSVPELRGMLLSKADAEMLDWVAAAGRSLGARDVPAAAIASPAALYVFNHSAYADPWLDHRSRAAMASLRQACQTSPPADLFVLQPGTQTARAPTTLAFKEGLAACGIRFSADFKLVARRVAAGPGQTMTIWRLKSPATKAGLHDEPSGAR